MSTTVQMTLARVLALCVLLFAQAQALPTVCAGSREEQASAAAPSSRAAGQEYFARKRAPVGQRAVPTERYALARAQMEKMRVYSTASGAFQAGAGEASTEAELEGLGAESLLAAVGTWTSLGPGNVGGRTRAIVFDPTPPGDTWYAAGVSGGVWKTTNAGFSWTPIGDSLANPAVSSLAMRPGFPGTILAGTGEGYFNEDDVRGAGIFKTVDGGATWTQLAGTDNSSFYYVNDIVWSPITGTIYAATGTGVFSSRDGGTTWTPILLPELVGGCLDLALRPSGSSDWLLASCGTFTEAKIYLTRFGETTLETGQWVVVLTEANMGRTSLAFAPAPSAIVYAMAAHKTTGALHAVFRSANEGETWSKRASSASLLFTDRVLLTNPVLKNCDDLEESLGWYANAIAVDPSDASGNTLWAGGVDLFRSTNGGLNWGPVSSWWETGRPHHVPANQHAIAFHPTSRQMVIGNDGGLFKMTAGPTAAGSFDSCANGGGTLSDAVFASLNNGYAVSQLTSGAVFPGDRAYLSGTQTTGTIKGTDSGGPNAWTTLWPGYGGVVAVDPSAPNVIFLENAHGSIRKSADGGASFPDHPSTPDGSWTDGIDKSGFLFHTPLVMDPSDPRRLWTGGASLYRTDDGAVFWKRASGVLVSSASAIAVAPSNPDVVFAGTSSGVIYRTINGLTAVPEWGSVRPRLGWVSSLAIDPTNPNVVYATYSTFGGIHVYKSANGGGSWSKADGTGLTGIPDVPVHSVAIDPTNSSRIYVGTDLGVFVSLNGGSSWAKENTGFANVVTETLVASGANLYAFTHGRGAWRVSLTNARQTTTVGFDATRATTAEEAHVVTFSLTLSTADHAPTLGEVTVSYATASGTATAGNDYTPVSGILTFPAGSSHGTRRHLAVSVLDDAYAEPRETFTVGLTRATGGALLGRRTYTIAIEDDGDPPGLSIGNVTVSEASSTAMFTVGLFPPVPDATVTVNYATADGTATAGPTGDYTAPAPGVLTFPPGTTLKTLTVPLKADTVAEPPETFFVNLSNATGAPMADGVAVATIIDNDFSGALQLSAPTFTVAESGTKATITVSRTGGAASGVTVEYATSDLTAKTPDDYPLTMGTLTFGAGVSSLPFYVPITNDTLDENDETLNVHILNPTGYGVVLGAQTTGVLSISDNDTAGVMAFSAATYAGAEGTSVLVKVRRTGGGASQATVRYATSDDTAQEPDDYTSTSGSLTFAANETEKTFSVPLLAEDPIVVEGDETLKLTLSGPGGGATLGTPRTAVLTIRDVSPSVSFSTGSVTASEASASVTLTVRRAGPPGTAVRVRYATADGTATAAPVGTNPADYTAVSSVLELAPFATSKTITIPLKADTLVEGPESFRVTLSNPEGSFLGPIPTSTVNITDNDLGGALEFSAANVNVNEPLTPPGSSPIKATITVKRSGGAASGVTVNWATVNGTATAPGDYAAAAGTLSFGAGVTSKTFIVEVQPDDDVEGHETFTLALDRATGGGTLGTRKEATVTVMDSEPVVQFSAPTYSATEGTPKATFTLKRTGNKMEALSVSLVSLGGTATGGVGGDYDNVPATVLLKASATSATFTVDILQDALLEPPEQVRFQLTGCAPLCTVGPQAITELTIKDDEPVVSFGAATYTVGEATAKVTFTLKRLGSKTPPLSVNLAVTGGTATGGGVDYKNVPATVLMKATVTSATFTVDIVNDTLAEPDETVELRITDVVGGFVGAQPTTVLTITDNEPSIAWSAAAYSVTEPLNTSSTPTELTFTVMRTGVLTQESTVDYAIVAGTATETVDYAPMPPTTATGTITFVPGAGSVVFTIFILHDTIDEPDETIGLFLSKATGAKLGTTVEATVTIEDND